MSGTNEQQPAPERQRAGFGELRMGLRLSPPLTLEVANDAQYAVDEAFPTALSKGTLDQSPLRRRALLYGIL